ncbi:MAG TPA: SDR family oxidoreductase [Phycisphaerales bacterium]|nr:SDR family oxidoreductase [Phycisphaerales bacterium]HMP37224.1 SDR family oxidoreductase [Phycisphaerales bacterium]
MSLASRHALVCGSTQGIGRACAMEFARQGASVTLVGRNDEGLAKVLAELPTSGAQRHRTLQLDFADAAGVEAGADAFVAEHGPVHILLHNTGGPPPGALFDSEPGALATAFAQHVLTAQGLARAVATGMRDERYGRIIAIVSTSVVTPIANLGVSNVIRAAMGNWMRTLAAELGPFGITVNNILPGFTKTARLESLFAGRAEREGSTIEEYEEGVRKSIPLRRLATPEEIAAVAGFLASPAASYLTGVNLPVDGGRLVT